MSAVELPAATMLSIWCRTAMAVVAFDCATDTSVHEGQRTSASMAAARCATVSGADVEGAAADHQRDAQHDQGERDPGPQGHRGVAAVRSLDIRACLLRAALRYESRFSWWPDRSSTAVTRPEGSMTNVVGGAVTP